MVSSGLVPPPHVAGPLGLGTFTALMLAPGRIADPASGRALARPYKEVAARLRRWRIHGQITEDSAPAIYLHEYTRGGITIRGLVGLLDVSTRASRLEDSNVLPHEAIYPAQADDLAERMDELAINPAPILLAHHQTPRGRELLREVRQQPPDHDFSDRARQQHRVWAIRDPELQRALNAELAQSRALIADGHHRYAAYLRLQQRHPGTDFDRGLAMVVDQGDTPLFVGAIHRVLHGTSLADLAVSVTAIGAGWQEVPHDEAVAALGPTTLVATDGKRWGVASLHVPDGRALVELLHDQLIPGLPHGPKRMTYHHSVDDTLKHARGSGAIAVLLPAADVDLVLRIVAAGRLLPEKATSFQPKPHLGVLLRSLHVE